MSGNIHTLQSVKHKKKKLIFHPILRGQFPKSNTFFDSIKTWREVASVNSNIGSIIPVPIDVKTKRPAEGVLFKATHENYKRWDTAKLDNWIKATKTRPSKFELAEYDLGILFGGGIAVLDFDCEADWNWFINSFGLDLTDYIICENISKHNCDCDSENEKTYHLYFKREGFFNAPKTRVDCILNEAGAMRHIDFLRDADSGTPHVSKIPTGESVRRIVNMPEDKVIKPLPALVEHHFKKNWRKTKAEIGKGERNYKQIELAKLIPKDNITSDNFANVVSELLEVGIDRDNIIELALDFVVDNRIGRTNANPARSYTNNEIVEWVNAMIDNHERTGDRGCSTINYLAREYNLSGVMTINVQYLKKLGSKFSTDYLWDVKYNIADTGERRKLVMKYYNHFFIITTGLKKNGIYFRKYDDNGSIKDIGLSQDYTSFKQASIQMILVEGGKEQNTADWWYQQKQITYDSVIFQPYGIKSKKHNISYDTFNTFQGYNMKYVSNYNKPENDHLGDMINKHLREVFSWDNKTEGGVNEELYNYYRAWLYKHAVLGLRTEVALVFYSKEMGTGKSLLLNGYREHVIGDNVSLLNNNFNKMIKDTFTDYYEACCLLVIEEMPDNSSKVKDAWDFMKSMTTESKMTSRKFMTAPDKMTIHISSMINTNHFYSIDPDFIDRRACVNRVSPHRKNDDDYFAKLASACDSYEGWENFIHRYLIKDYHEFSSIQVKATSSLIPKTKYRKELQSRTTDSVLYFFKEFMDCIRNDKTPETPYGHAIGKHISMKGLWEKYKYWREVNAPNAKHFEETQVDFEKKLRNKFEIDSFSRSHTNTTEFLEANGKQTLSLSRTRRGNAIVFSEELIKKLNTLIKNNTLTEEEVLVGTEEELNDLEIDLDEVFKDMPCEDGFLGADY